MGELLHSKWSIYKELSRGGGDIHHGAQEWRKSVASINYPESHKRQASFMKCFNCIFIFIPLQLLIWYHSWVQSMHNWKSSFIILSSQKVWITLKIKACDGHKHEFNKHFISKSELHSSTSVSEHNMLITQLILLVHRFRFWTAYGTKRRSWSEPI